MPSTLSRSAMGGIKIELVKCTDSQVVLVLSPRMPLVEIKSTYRSSVLVVPINVPPTSTIANAMGRATAGEKWIAKASASPANGVTSGIVGAGSTTRLEASQDSLLRKLNTFISQKRPQAADEAFFAWVGQEEKRKLDLEGSHTVLFGHEFTKQVLETVLQLDKGAGEILYSGNVVRSLLERKVVVSKMVPDGLLGVLVDRSDWVCIPSFLSEDSTPNRLLPEIGVVGDGICVRPHRNGYNLRVAQGDDCAPQTHEPQIVIRRRRRNASRFFARSGSRYVVVGGIPRQMHLL